MNGLVRPIEMVEPRFANEKLLQASATTPNNQSLVAQVDHIGQVSLSVQFAVPRSDIAVDGIFLPGAAHDLYSRVAVPDGSRINLSLSAPTSAIGEWSEPPEPLVEPPDADDASTTATGSKLMGLIPELDSFLNLSGLYEVSGGMQTRQDLVAVVRRGLEPQLTGSYYWDAGKVEQRELSMPFDAEHPYDPSRVIASINGRATDIYKQGVHSANELEAWEFDAKPDDSRHRPWLFEVVVLATTTVRYPGLSLRQRGLAAEQQVPRRNANGEVEMELRPGSRFLGAEDCRALGEGILRNTAAVAAFGFELVAPDAPDRP